VAEPANNEVARFEVYMKNGEPYVSLTQADGRQVEMPTSLNGDRLSVQSVTGNGPNSIVWTATIYPQDDRHAKLQVQKSTQGIQGARTSWYSFTKAK
jgi:hypothetical protein